jgi:hypothetical protein
VGTVLDTVRILLDTFPQEGDSKKMTVKTVRWNDVMAKASRNRKSALYDLPEWKQAVRRIDAGLKKDEAVRIELSGAALKRLENPSRVMVRLLNKYIQKKGLGYVAFRRGKTEAGNPILYVLGNKQVL